MEKDRYSLLFGSLVAILIGVVVGIDPIQAGIRHGFAWQTTYVTCSKQGDCYSLSIFWGLIIPILFWIIGVIAAICAFKSGKNHRDVRPMSP